MFCLKRSQSRSFCGTFQDIEQKNVCVSLWVALEFVSLRREKKNQATPKTRVVGFIWKFPTSTLILFIWESALGENYFCKISLTFFFFTAAVFEVLAFDLIKLHGFFFLPQIVGLNTNISFLSSLCEHGHFKAGDVHTDFIKVARNRLHNKTWLIIAIIHNLRSFEIKAWKKKFRPVISLFNTSF